jgi:aminopeptidase-like protein
MLKIMDCIDGTNSIIDIADKLKICFSDVKYFVDNLVAVGLVSPRDASL